jgi:pyridoxamine 5'-phosphate oxidase family protein
VLPPIRRLEVTRHCLRAGPQLSESCSPEPYLAVDPALTSSAEEARTCGPDPAGSWQPPAATPLRSSQLPSMMPPSAGTAPTYTRSTSPPASVLVDPIGTTDEDLLDGRRPPWLGLSNDEQFVCEFDFGESSEHLRTVVSTRIDPIAQLGILPDRSLPFWVGQLSRTSTAGGATAATARYTATRRDRHAGGRQGRAMFARATASTIDIRGFNPEESQGFRNITDNGRAAFVVDDLASVQAWRVRCIEIRGVAEALTIPNGRLIRLYPKRIISFGIDEPDIEAHNLRTNNRNVD